MSPAKTESANVKAHPKNSYDEVPYESFPFQQTHPDRLATIATLFGLRPANVEKCRVLELGCASGGNLIPMAAALPDSEFLGVDFSQRQISAAQDAVQELGFHNLEFKHASILEITPSWGQFDYIIAHGVYSWVPNEVQAKLLEVCSSNLAPQGIAYVSYNTFPGWHLRGMIRDMMHYHASRYTDPRQRLREARALVDFLAGAVPADNNPYGLQLRKELDNLGQQSDNYLYHEQLEDVNDPIYFYQFVDRAKLCGLQYLGEADFRVMTTWGFSPETEKTLHHLATDLIQMEQYMDFVRNRTFRQTLLCRDDLPLSRNITANHLLPMYVSSPLRPSAKNLDVRNAEPAEFTGPHGLKFTSSDVITKAAILALSEVWPRALSLAELHDKVWANFESMSIRDASSITAETRELAGRLINCFISDLVEINIHRPRFTTQVSERPAATTLQRRQAQRSNLVTNLRHQSVRLTDVQRRLLQCLDGNCDRKLLLAQMTTLVREGTLVVQDRGKRVEDAATVETLLTGVLESSLEELARQALLSPSHESDCN